MSTTRSYYPTTLTDELAEKTRQTFAEMTTAPAASVGASTGTAPVGAPDEALATTEAPERLFISVIVKMPHVARYGREPIMTLTYGCSFAVSVGDTVLCPPTRLNGSWTKGVVTDLDGTGYRGRVKYVKPLGATKKLGK